MQTEDDEPIRIPITDVFDLHTIPPRDVRAVVEEYLIEAHRMGYRALRIIHGRGIGAQREMVRSVLSRTPFVTEFRDAPAAAGGWGATIVTLRLRSTGGARRNGTHIQFTKLFISLQFQAIMRKPRRGALMGDVSAKRIILLAMAAASLGWGQQSTTISTTISTPASSLGNTYAYGNTTTLTAVVTPVLRTSSFITGTVLFLDGNARIGAVTIAAYTASPVTVTCAAVLLTGGTHTITAQYSGDGNFSPS